MGLQVGENLLEDLLGPNQCFGYRYLRQLILRNSRREVLDAINERVLHNLLHRSDSLDSARDLRVETLRQQVERRHNHIILFQQVCSADHLAFCLVNFELDRPLVHFHFHHLVHGNLVVLFVTIALNDACPLAS